MAGIEQVGYAFIDAVLLPLAECGFNISGLKDQLRNEAAMSMARLASSIGTEGYDDAVQAERDILSIRAGLKLVELADEADAKAKMIALGVIEGALRMGAGVLSGGTRK